MSVAKPLTAEMIKARAKANAQAAGLSAYEMFFKALAKNMANELQLFNAAPVKCAVAGVSIESLPTSKQAGCLHRLTSTNGPLRIWSEADRAFDYLLAELCMGGSGVANVESEEQRPLSKFERKLRDTVLRILVFTVPAAAEVVHGVALEEAAPLTEDQKLQEPRAETTIALRLLVNVFTLAGEVTVHFSADELPRVLGVVAAVDEGDDQRTLKTLEKTPFELTVFLKPQMFPLQKVLSMKPGEVFPLSIDMNSPVSIYFEGKHISEASMNVADDRIGITLEHAENPSQTFPSPFSSVG